jgi:hypothetical protein
MQANRFLDADGLAGVVDDGIELVRGRRFATPVSWRQLALQWRIAVICIALAVYSTKLPSQASTARRKHDMPDYTGMKCTSDRPLAAN